MRSRSSPVLTIQLAALWMQGATAVVDDRAARRAAKALSLPVTGTFGVIVRAKRRGIIDAAKPVIRAVLETGLYYDDESVRTLLEAMGESWP